MKKLIITAICAIALLASCTSPSVPDSYNEAQRKPQIYPEYTDVTIPCNIAPMNFMVAENCEEAVAKFTYGNEEAVYGDGGEKGAAEAVKAAAPCPGRPMDKRKSPGRPGDFLCSGAGESPAGGTFHRVARHFVIFYCFITR